MGSSTVVAVFDLLGGGKIIVETGATGSAALIEVILDNRPPVELVYDAPPGPESGPPVFVVPTQTRTALYAGTMARCAGRLRPRCQLLIYASGLSRAHARLMQSGLIMLRTGSRAIPTASLSQWTALLKMTSFSNAITRGTASSIGRNALSTSARAIARGVTISAGKYVMLLSRSPAFSIRAVSTILGNTKFAFFGSARVSTIAAIIPGGKIALSALTGSGAKARAMTSAVYLTAFGSSISTGRGPAPTSLTDEQGRPLTDEQGRPLTGE